MHSQLRPAISHGRVQVDPGPPPFPFPGPRQALYHPWQTRRTYGDIRLEDPLLMNDLFQQPRQPFNNQGYMPNGAPASGPVPGATPLLPNQGRVLQQGPIRVLCIADVRGRTSTISAYRTYAPGLIVTWQVT
jgi:hypothetical protein